MRRRGPRDTGGQRSRYRPARGLPIHFTRRVEPPAVAFMCSGQLLKEAVADLEWPEAGYKAGALGMQVQGQGTPADLPRIWFAGQGDGDGGWGAALGHPPEPGQQGLSHGRQQQQRTRAFVLHPRCRGGLPLPPAPALISPVHAAHRLRPPQSVAPGRRRHPSLGTWVAKHRACRHKTPATQQQTAHTPR